MEGLATVLGRPIHCLAWIVAALAPLFAGCGPSAGSLPNAPRSLPDGFADTRVVALGDPLALAPLPDGRLLATTKNGELWLVSPSRKTKQLLLDLRNRVCTERERGLSGVAASPHFGRDGYVYLYYTFRKGGKCGYGHIAYPVNRLSRFRLREDKVDPASEKVILDKIPSFGATHNAGDIHFGNDGLLYVSVGDGGRDYRGRSDSSLANGAARDMNVLLGKIVRINPDGSVPAGNPYHGKRAVRCALAGVAPPGKVCREIFATGLRNPFRLAFDPNVKGTRFYINDVGEYAYEEVDEGIRGADYGWNLYEGPCVNDYIHQPFLRFHVPCGKQPKGLTPPLFAYRHPTCGAITGAAFVPNGSWPTSFRNAYLFADFNCGRIVALMGKGRELSRTVFAQPQLVTLISMVFGRKRYRNTLYYTTYAGGGEVRAIRYR